MSLGSVLTKCSPWASPPQLRPWGRTSKEPSSARERPPPRGLFLLPTAALDGPRRYRRRPRSSPMTLPDPTGDAVRFSALRSSAEISVGAANPHRGSSRAKGLRRQRLLQAKLSRNSNQIARGRIRRFESYMPSQPVRLQRVTYEDRSKTARHREVSRISTRSPCAKFGHGSVISLPRLRFLVSRFMCALLSVPKSASRQAPPGS